MNLYSRLLKYQSTPERSNLENFLSEALCDFLNRLDQNVCRTFLEKLLGTKCLENVPVGLRFETQVSIPSMFGIKYPDIVGFSMGVPAIIIENKIDAAFTRSSNESEDGKLVEAGQLEVYGQWIHSESPNAPLVLLTRWTQPPDDFYDTKNAHNYGTCNRICINWQNIFGQLKTMKDIPLGYDLQNFLQEERLAMDNPTRQDFFALELFLGSSFPRISYLMTDIRKQLIKDFENSCDWKKEASFLKKGFDFSPGSSLISSWGNLPFPQYSFIHWGFCFPNENADELGIKGGFPVAFKSPFFFIGITINDERQYQVIQSDPPIGWESNTSSSYKPYQMPCLCYIKLDSLLEESNFNVDLYRWIKLHFMEADERLKKLIWK